MEENNFWTKTSIEQLKKLVSKGFSTAEIANRLGISKNAVIGKLNRLGWNSAKTTQYQTFPHLIAVFIENHKNSVNKLYNFSNKYKVSLNSKCSDSKFEFKIEPVSVDQNNCIINDYSLRVVVGKNGTGKTSLVESLRMETTKSKYERNWNDDIDGAIYFCASDSGNFAWYYRGVSLNHKDKYVCNEIVVDKYDIKKSDFLVSNQRKTDSLYYSIPELLQLYSNYGIPAFFIKEKINFDYFSFVIGDEFQSTSNKEKNEVLYKLIYNNETLSNPELYFLYYTIFFRQLSLLGHNISITGENIKTYYDLERLYYQLLNSALKTNNISNIDKIINDIEQFFIENDIEVTSYPLSHRVKLTTLSDKLLSKFKFDVAEIGKNKKIVVSSYMKMKLRHSYIPDWFLDILFSVDLLRFNKNTNRFYRYSELSRGEQSIIGMFAEIFVQILNIGEKSKNNMVIVLDEPTNALHPEWQRKFIYYLNDFIKHMPEQYRKRIDNVILTTHSPFILTDIGKNEIIFLQDMDSNIKIEEIPGTFSGNIHTLLAKPFFMNNGTIGELAKIKVEELVNFYNLPIEQIKSDNKSHNKYMRLLDLMDDGNLIKMVLKDKIDNKLELLKNETI